jgi:predicted DNA-binding protein
MLKEGTKARRNPDLGYVGIRLSVETRKGLQALAKADGRTESGFIRVILERFLKAEAGK